MWVARRQKTGGRAEKQKGADAEQVGRGGGRSVRYRLEGGGSAPKRDLETAVEELAGAFGWNSLVPAQAQAEVVAGRRVRSGPDVRPGDEGKAGNNSVAAEPERALVSCMLSKAAPTLIPSLTQYYFSLVFLAPVYVSELSLPYYVII